MLIAASTAEVRHRVGKISFAAIDHLVAPNATAART